MANKESFDKIDNAENVITLNVKEAIQVPFLPTAKSRKERVTWLPVEVPVRISVLDEKAFPVAFKVTDFSSTLNGVTQEEFKEKYCDGKSSYNYDNDKSRADEDNSYKTEEIRFYNGRLYKPVHINLHGTLNSSLYESNPDFIRNNLSSRYIYMNEEYSESRSVVNEREKLCQIESVKKRKQEAADGYVMFDGRVWEECGEPYFKILYFGMLGRPAAFINYAKRDRFDQTCQADFSSLHKEEWLKSYADDYWPYSPDNPKFEYVKAICKDDFPIKPEDIKENIEVLMPECVKIRDFIDVENERQQELNSRLDTIADKVIESEDKRLEIPLIKLFEAEMKSILDSGITNNPYVAYKKITEKWTQEKKDELNSHFKEKGIRDKNGYDNYFSKTFGLTLNKSRLPAAAHKAKEMEREGR